MYDLLDALITVQTSPEDAEEKLGVLSSQLAGRLRSLSAKVQEHRVNSDQESLRKTLREYETALEKLVACCSNPLKVSSMDFKWFF